MKSYHPSISTRQWVTGNQPIIATAIRRGGEAGSKNLKLLIFAAEIWFSLQLTN